MGPLRKTLLASGILVLFCVSAVPVSAGDPPETVTVVVYNLKNYLAMERRINGEIVESAPKPESEIAPLIEGIVSIAPDILGVCEIGDATYLGDLQSRLRAKGIDLPHTELVTDAGGYNRNVGLLSRFPITGRQSRSDYTYAIGGTKQVFQRGVLDAKIAITPHYTLRYVGLHLKSKREVTEGDQAVMRLNEARLARQHIDRIFESEPDVNLLVAGDLNDLRIEAPIKTLQGSFGQTGYLSALTLADPYGFRWTHHWSFADSYSRIDFALYSQGLSRELNRNLSRIHHWDDWDKASDHRPLVISFSPVNK